MIRKVAPRDIFNDANYLKNLSFLLAKIKIGELPGLGCSATEKDILSPHFLTIDDSSGDTFSPNGTFFKIDTNESLNLGRPANSRNPFPVFFTDEDYGIYDVFYDDGSLRSDLDDILTSQETFENLLVKPERVMAQSLAMKGIAKIALTVIDAIDDVRAFNFDEDKYSAKGIAFDHRDGFFYVESEGLLFRDNQAVTLRSPDMTKKDDLWPLEFSVGDEDFARVYNQDGSFNPVFLKETPSQMIMPKPLGAERQPSSIRRKF